MNIKCYPTNKRELLINEEDRKYNRLQLYIIIVNSTLLRYLLETVFFFQQPLAPVYIVESVEKANQLFYNFENDIGITKR